MARPFLQHAGRAHDEHRRFWDCTERFSSRSMVVVVIGVDHLHILNAEALAERLQFDPARGLAVDGLTRCRG